MNSQTPTQASAPIGITEKLRGSIVDIESSLETLQHAVIGRDVQKVWETLAELEGKIDTMDQYRFLWQHYVADSSGNADLAKDKETIELEIKKLQVKTTCNSKLVRSFLGAINRALKSAGTKIAGRTNVYGRTGRMKVKQSSLMFQQVG